ncbi:MAG: T9SS type A sorting domain-containing protein [Saprospiraceae bacterium]
MKKHPHPLGFGVALGDTRRPSFSKTIQKGILVWLLLVGWSHLSAQNCPFGSTEVLSVTATSSAGATQTWTNTSGQPVYVRIIATGAGGGQARNASGTVYNGGTGARVEGNFTVTNGQTLRAIVGGWGESATGNVQGGGGGGGTGAVNVSTSSILLIAGGGNGASGDGIQGSGAFANSSNGDGGGVSNPASGGGGINGAGSASFYSSNCPGGGQVSLTGLSAGGSCARAGGSGMGGGGGSDYFAPFNSSTGGGGGGQTGGWTTGSFAAYSINYGSNQTSAHGTSGAAAANTPGVCKICLLECTFPTAFTVTGGGSLCPGGSGATIELSGSESGMTYQVRRDGNNVGGAVSGTGNALSFGPYTTGGTYTIVATNPSGGCSLPMMGSATVAASTAPLAYNVTGGGGHCYGGGGVAVGLSNSESGMSYQLKRDGSDYGDPVSGTGSAITFGNFTQAGTYTVVATNPTGGCTQNMTGSAAIYISPTIAGINFYEPSNCMGNNTTCTGDDYFTADLLMIFYNPHGIPTSGFVTLESPHLVEGPINVPASSMTSNFIFLEDVAFVADGQTVTLEVSMSDYPDCSFTTTDLTAATPCSEEYVAPNHTSVTLSGISDCTQFNGTYNYVYDEDLNGHAWVHESDPNIMAYYYYEDEFWLYDDGTGYAAGYVEITGDIFPCTGWESYDCDLSQMVISSDCGSSLLERTCDISEITVSNPGTCNDNGTTTVADDDFQATVTVKFAYAPSTGNLTVKHGPTVVATKSAADLSCVTEWTFENVLLAANGSDIILTAEFGTECTFTSPSLGTAPAACSCVPVTEICNGVDDDCDLEIDEDSTPPTAICKPASVTLTSAGTAMLSAASINHNSSDDCSAAGDLTLTASPNLFTCSDAGGVSVTLTVHDEAGNSASCTATVTVLDVLHHTQKVQRMASDGLAGDNLGWGIAIDGQILISGAPNDKIGTQNKQGSAYVFLQNQGSTDNWGQLKQIKASDGAAVDYFGNAISVDGSTALVGAHGDNVGTTTDAGSAYIFEKDLGSPNNWGQRTSIVARDGATAESAAYDYFANAVALKNGRAVIGAAKKKIGANTSQGAAYIYEKDAGGPNNWGNVRKLTASDGAANNFFGQSVAQSGNLVLVGANGNLSNRGAAYLFDGSNNWAQLQKLTASDAAVGDGFGTSLSLTDDYALISAMNKATYTGAAYVFKNTAGTWSQIKKLTASDGAANDRFGASVALSGDYAYVAALRANSDAGAVYVFHKNTGGPDNWGEIGKYTAESPASGDQFGYALATSGQYIAIGANLDDVGAKADQGSVYVFKGEDCPDMTRPAATATAAARGLAVSPSVQCWPNPFRDELTIEIAQSGISNLASEIQFIDAVGRVMARVDLPASASRFTLKTENFRAGMYFVQVSSEGGTQVVPVALVR